MRLAGGLTCTNPQIVPGSQVGFPWGLSYSGHCMHYRQALVTQPPKRTRRGVWYNELFAAECNNCVLAVSCFKFQSSTSGLLFEFETTSTVSFLHPELFYFGEARAQVKKEAYMFIIREYIIIAI